METELRARVLRGSSEVGGSCLELAFGGSTILLDAGAPLTGDRGGLPSVTGIGEPGPLPLAVVVSHGHQDHWGLVPELPPSVPVWVGRGAADVLRAAEFWGTGVDLREAGHLFDRKTFAIGPFTITPHLADHSGFDAYSLLVEAGGKRLFYTGDVRGHGRKHSLRRLVEDPPRDVDALVMEGTSIRQPCDPDGRGPEPLESESAVERTLAGTLEDTSGLVVVLSSPQNIDRSVTAYRAALRAGRNVAVDLYTADVLKSTGRVTIPRVGAEWPRVRAFVPLHQRVKVKEAREFERVRSVGDQRVFADEIADDPALWVLFGAYQRELTHLLRSGALAGGAVVWSMWAGYLDQPAGVRLTNSLAAAGVPLLHHHTSGHATVGDLKRLVSALAPRYLVPIHTEAPTMFASTFDVPTRMEGDGAWWTV